MGEFIRVGKLSEFREGRGRAVRVGDEKVAVFRRGDRWFAIQDACPHMGASLADGKLDGDQVVCHWHHWKFKLEDGQSDMRSWCRARVYETKIADGALYLKPPPAADPEPAAPRKDEEWIAWDPDRFFKKKD